LTSGVVDLRLGVPVVQNVAALNVCSPDYVVGVLLWGRTARCERFKDLVHVVGICAFDMLAQRLGVGIEFAVEVCGDLDRFKFFFGLHRLCGSASLLLGVRLLRWLGSRTLLERQRHCRLERVRLVTLEHDALV
jgi:hypothetical protein